MLEAKQDQITVSHAWSKMHRLCQQRWNSKHAAILCQSTSPLETRETLHLSTLAKTFAMGFDLPCQTKHSPAQHPIHHDTSWYSISMIYQYISYDTYDVSTDHWCHVIPSALILNLSSRRHVARCSWDSWGRAMAARSVRHPKAFLGGENALDATVEYIWKADSFVFVSDLDPAVLKHIETPLDPLGYKRRCQFFKWSTAWVLHKNSQFSIPQIFKVAAVGIGVKPLKFLYKTFFCSICAVSKQTPNSLTPTFNQSAGLVGWQLTANVSGGGS